MAGITGFPIGGGAGRLSFQAASRQELLLLRLLTRRSAQRLELLVER